jgi:acyl-CoA thioesterase I
MHMQARKRHPPFSVRRRLMALAGGAIACTAVGRNARAIPVAAAVALYTFGDSVLDCGHYNAYGVHPGQLIVENDDRLFPEFSGRDLRSRGPAHLTHRATDGATVDSLPGQASGIGNAPPRSIALLTIGGNDLLRGLAADATRLPAFRAALERFLRDLPLRPVLIGNVYDPTFGYDTRNFLPIDAGIARANHGRVNATIAEVAARHGRLVDLHAHFLRGDPSWFAHTIEPSLIGASEVRRAFLAAL